MIVYGDPSFEADAADLATDLRRRAAAAAAATRNVTAAHGLDGSRTLLILAGQLEQALHDADASHPDLPAVQRATDHAARAFLAAWRALNAAGHRDDSARRPGDASALLPSLDGALLRPGLSVRVKVPEGFAFYTLYPEQYCVAADRWCDDHVPARAAGPVLVAGIRSIGTSLSAVVAAVLADRGFDAHRLTVRPTGHPFDRRATLADAPAGLWRGGAAHALVVDEGPGISGSSMAAVAAACEDEAGVPPDRIAFLPGHGGEPGHAASAVVRERWNRTRRYVTPLADLRWAGHSLPDLLAAATQRLLQSPVVRQEDLSGGRWRRHVRPPPPDDDVPPAFAPFERTKYLLTSADGRSVLWKFAGLGGRADEDFARQRRVTAGGWTPAPIAVEHGFVATPWLNGFLAGPHELDNATLARYVSEAAGEPLTEREQSAALSRLREMLFWNAKESLGDAAAERASRWSDWMAARSRRRPIPRYGDGRLDRHEWIHSDGRIYKTDCTGHDRDHTIVGPQPVAWDVAGALVEWELESLPFPKDTPVDPTELSFYRAAYAAFRLGVCTLCASLLGAGDPERIRLLDAAERYRADLARSLSQHPPPRG